MTSISQLRRTAVARMTTSGRPRLRVLAAGILAAISLAVGLGGAQTASADMSVGGVYFRTDATCSPAPKLEVDVKADTRANVWAMTYLSRYESRTRTWTPWENGPWHSASESSAESWVAHEDFHPYRYGHFYYKVMIHFAVPTSTGWRYGGEYINPYIQINPTYYAAGFNQPEYSSTCYM